MVNIKNPHYKIKNPPCLISNIFVLQNPTFRRGGIFLKNAKVGGGELYGENAQKMAEIKHGEFAKKWGFLILK